MSPSAELLVDATLLLGELEVSAAFSVGRGELVAIAGGVGAGKSSVLRLVTGVTRADRGIVQFQNEIWDCTDSGAFVPPEQRSVALVPQDFRSMFDPEECPRAALMRLRPAHEATALLHALALGDHVIDRAVRTLSNGEAQRAAIAYALAQRPDILLLDEPFV
ncbi:MAG: ATP-binding cassette domain-containing protein, partial [Acidimicrobiales bacterium]